MVLVWRIMDDSPNSPNFPAIQYLVFSDLNQCTQYMGTYNIRTYKMCLLLAAVLANNSPRTYISLSITFIFQLEYYTCLLTIFTYSCTWIHFNVWHNDVVAWTSKRSKKNESTPYSIMDKPLSEHHIGNGVWFPACWQKKLGLSSQH